jgi:hypothetical protein
MQKAELLQSPIPSEKEESASEQCRSITKTLEFVLFFHTRKRFRDIFTLGKKRRSR